MAENGNSGMLDLSSLDTKEASEKGAVLEVLHPIEGTPLGIKITLAGADSDIYRTAWRKMVDKMSQRQRPGQRLNFAFKDQDEGDLDVQATCTLAWEGVLVDGQEIACSKENAKELYRRFPWIREQVVSFMGDRANFLQR